MFSCDLSEDRGTPPFETQCNRFRLKNNKKQAGAELCQAQLRLKLVSHKVGSSLFLTANSLAD